MVRLLVASLISAFAFAPFYARSAIHPSVAAKYFINCDLLLASRIPWFDKITFSEIENILSHGEIIGQTDLLNFLSASGRTAEGSTKDMQLLSLKSGIQAVWKPGPNYPTEIAAYKVARRLGLKLIPPTVERIVNGVPGSAQYFVETPFDLVKMNEDSLIDIWQVVDQEQKSQRDIFNFVFGEWDRHWGNILIDENYSLVMIDNAAIATRQQVRYGEKPFLAKLRVKDDLKIVEYRRFPFDEAILLVQPSHNKLAAFLKKYVEPLKVKYFMKWMKDVRDLSMRLVIWDNCVWIQPLGYNKYPPIIPATFPPEFIQKLRALDFASLREIFHSDNFSDKYINEILERRDQIIKAANPNKPVQKPGQI